MSSILTKEVKLVFPESTLLQVSFCWSIFARNWMLLVLWCKLLSNTLWLLSFLTVDQCLKVWRRILEANELRGKETRICVDIYFIYFIYFFLLSIAIDFLINFYQLESFLRLRKVLLRKTSVQLYQKSFVKQRWVQHDFKGRYITKNMFTLAKCSH